MAFAGITKYQSGISCKAGNPAQIIEERNIMGRMQRTLTSAIYISTLLAAAALWPIPLLATNYTVKSGGGGNYSTIQQCATAMASGDTCTVFAGTYNENVTVPAGTAGNYKTITVNGSDVVTVNSVTLGPHTKLVGNCTPGAAAGSCGFTFDHSSSPGGTCLALSGGATDVFIRGNTLLACGRINPVSGNTYYSIQGNTFAYAGCAPPNLNHTCGQWIADWGDYSLVENNDFSHYQLGANIQGTHHIWRNNTSMTSSNLRPDRISTATLSTWSRTTRPAILCSKGISSGMRLGLMPRVYCHRMTPALVPAHGEISLSGLTRYPASGRERSRMTRAGRT